MACSSPVTFVKYSVIKIFDIVYFRYLQFQFSFQVTLYGLLLEEDLLQPAVTSSRFNPSRTRRCFKYTFMLFLEQSTLASQLL